MPVAEVSIDEVERLELKSIPGAWVDLRRMTYGQMVQRRALTKLSVLNGGKNRSVVGEMAMASKEVTVFEFAHCIVDHNLEKKDGSKFNLSSEVDFDRLHPKVGQEIESKIAEMNNFEEGDEQEK